MADFSGLRIGLVGPVPPPAGGMANQTRQLMELLRAGGAKVTLLPTNAPYRPAWAGQLPGLRALFRLLPYLLSLWRAAGRSDVFHVMANSGWSWHLFCAPAILVAHARRVPVVVNYRGGAAANFLARSQRLVRFAMARSAALIVPSRFLVEVFGRFGMGARVVPNIIDLARFSGRDDAAAQRTPGAHLVVARHLEALYDNETALRAFALVRAAVPSATLTLAGSGPEAQRLKDLAHSLGLTEVVHLPGTLDRDAMAALYRRADVLLNPSLADNMPNSVLEAMASGVPVVSTNVGGVPFVVDAGRTGLLVPPGQPQAMADAVMAILTDPALRQHLSSQGLAEAQRYGWPQVADTLRQVYASACAGH